uniref:Retrotransposon protein, putative, unclassified n=1 Tax=Oryza sativa subsp. japonica TaxID=39947 RepID=Q2QRJ0_ORYSJ|nr:retrotransposon protein, putative, unclassified [Oryza sativa Japonica Group]
MRNLDGPMMSKTADLAKSSLSSTSYLDPSIGMHSNLPSSSIVYLSNEQFSSNLGKIGVSLGSGSENVAFSVNAIKHMEVDRWKVAPKPKMKAKVIDEANDQNPFHDGDDEDAEPDGILLAHLVKEVSEVDLDDAELSRTICDLIATPRKSKSASKKKGEFYVKFHLRNKEDRFEWILMAVYGPAQDEFKSSFLAELVRACQQNPHPTLIGGDFNILRSSIEKNNKRYNDRWPFLFNAVIDSFDLREIALAGRQFTWANSLANPTYEKLDRVLMTTEWESKFPMVSVHALEQGVSDHTPLLLDSGSTAFIGNHKQFKLELSWLTHDDFHDRVVKIWNKPVKGRNLVQQWNNKMSALRKHLRGWAAHMSGMYKQEKKSLQSTVDELDIAVEVRVLTEVERDQLTQARDRLVMLLREEETKWFQRAKTSDVRLGDNNTKYFQMVANGKHRKKRIFYLEQDEGKIEGQAALKAYITSFYKKLFGPPEDNPFTLDESRSGDISQVTQAENEFLMAPFLEKEIRDAVFDMEHNKAPGLDGFPAEFYQKFWEVIKHDLMNLFHELHTGELPLFSLNFGVITLLPKVKEANRIQQYRPICLLNVSFKLFTKVATNRINSVADHVVSPTQTAFMRGRNILEGVVILHETLHELHRKKLNGVIFKIDFEKAYDKVKWPFLMQALGMKGFSTKWISWIESFVSGGSASIKVNDDVGPFFQTKKGLRQGDPLSPMLFNIVADMFVVLINRANVDGQICGVVPHLVDDGISILQYADDAILFMDHDLEKARNMKLLLCAFEQLSDLPNIDKVIWKLKIPLKVKIFLWYLRRGVVLTRDNLAKRNWQGRAKQIFQAGVFDFFINNYPSEAWFMGFGCSGVSALGAGGQGMFYQGTWVAV